MGVKKSLLNYFKNHLFLSFIIILIIIFVTILALVPPQILRIIVDNVVLTGETQKLFLFSILYLISYLLIGVTNFAKELVLVILSQGISTNLRKEMMMHIHKMNYENFINNDAGTLESYFSNDVDAIDALITSGIISMVIDLLKMIGIIISIFVFSTMFGFLSVAILPLIIFITFGFKKLMFKAQLNNRRIEGNVNNLVLEGLDNIITIKVFQAYNYFKNKYINVLKNHYQTIKKSNFYDSIFAPIMQIIKTVVIVAIVLISSYNYNLFGISVGVLVSIIDLITDLFKPIENLGMELQTIQKSLAGISRINQFFNFEASNCQEDNTNIKNFEKNIKIEFRNVYFEYEKNAPVIKNFNLVINNNDKIVLKGRSGAGKSTIFKLISGIILPTSGDILINGISTLSLPCNIKSELFSILFQDTFFSNGTVKEELTLLKKDVPDDIIWESLQKIGLKDRINSLDEKLDYHNFSTGEQVLLNLARVIIRDSKIILLDEMNAKIDPLTANRIIKLINDFAKNKIILSINHYGENIENARIIEL